MVIVPTPIPAAVAARERPGSPPAVPLTAATDAAVRPAGVTARAVLLGLVGTVVINAITYYNDYVLNNTFVVGNNLPLGAILLVFLFSVFVNGPLSRYAPRHAFSSGEVTVAFAMTLLSCGLPSSGVMRYLPSALVGPPWLARANGEYLRLLEAANLPPWLFPSFAGPTLAERLNDPVVTGFVGRWTSDAPVPYAAWLVPFASWGVFTIALFVATLCLVVLVRRQWFENERLAFPLAQIQLALVEQPRAGQFFNAVMRERSFWVAFALVFVLHAWNGSAQYSPKVPAIPLRYDFHAILAEPPFGYIDGWMKSAPVFFAVIGVTYFIPTSVAFSLWFCFVALQASRMVLGTATGDPGTPGLPDQHLGAIVAFALAILWTGRRHWRLVLRQAFRGEGPGEPREPYLSYRAAFWTLLACAAVLVAWMWAAGATPLGAAVTVVSLLVLFMVITRVVAESGIIHGMLVAHLWRPWELLASYGVTGVVPLKTFYLTSMVNSVFFDYREVVPVYASHGMKLADQTMLDGGADGRADRATGRRFFAALVLALVVAYAVSFFATLHVEYGYGVTKDEAGAAPINGWGVGDALHWWNLSPAVRYQTGNYHFGHNQLAHVAGGFTIATLLSILRWRYAWWPLHPIGYLMLATFPVIVLWFSIFLGWVVKVLVLRFGGAQLFVAAKPFMLGLIVGESIAAAAWLVLGIVFSSLGLPYRAIMIMPW